MEGSQEMIETSAAERFLSGRRFAVVGASDDDRSFGKTVYTELRDRGYEVVPVNRRGETVAGDRCYPSVGALPAPVDGVVVMVGRDDAVDVVRDCVEQGVPRVWLFKGLGAPGSVSAEAVSLCEDNGIDVVAGACPLMFLEPVGWFHKIHRGMRHLNGSLSRA